MNKNILIIGGGAWGLSTAFHLANQGVKDILVLERNYIASGQSGHTSAIVRQLYTNETTAKIARMSLEFFRKFKENVGYDLDFNQVGLVVVSFEKDSMLSTIERLKNLGIRYEVLNNESLKSIDKNLKVRDDEIAIYEPEAGYVDPIETTWNFAKAAMDKGVQIIEGEKVVSIGKKEGWIVKTTNREYNASKLVVAAGIETPKIVSNLGLNLPVYLIPFPICYIKRPYNFSSLNYVFFDFSVNYYTRPEEPSQIIVGAVHPQMSYSSAEGYVPDEIFHWSKVDTEVSHRADYETLKAYLEGLRFRFDNLKEIKVVRDLMPYVDITPDWEPIIDEIEEDLYIACGSSGHGFKLSPMIGRMISELVIYKKSKVIDAKPYSIKRYRKWEK